MGLVCFMVDFGLVLVCSWLVLHDFSLLYGLVLDGFVC